MKWRNLLFITSVVCTAMTVAHAEVAVIVHPSATFADMSEDEISRLFLGKAKNFPNGEPAIPINQDEGSATRDKFNDGVVKKNAAQLKAYWSQLVFTGKGTPPKDVGKDTDVKKLVSSNPNMVGYVDASLVDGSVKVVFKSP